MKSALILVGLGILAVGVVVYFTSQDNYDQSDPQGPSVDEGPFDAGEVAAMQQAAESGALQAGESDGPATNQGVNGDTY